MTPEERWRKIDNFMATAAEHQARHEQYLARHEEHLARHDEDIREIREIHKSMSLAIMKVAELQRSTEEKLVALIGTVDRLMHGPDDQTAH